MVNFKSLFGIEKSQIQKNCVLTPIMSKGILGSFGIKNLSKGRPYSSGSNDGITLIHTQIGAPFAGDAVLYLEKTPCRNVILFGSCGLVKKTRSLDIGACLLVNNCNSFESFSSLLNKEEKTTVTKSDSGLFKEFSKIGHDKGLNIVNCATFGSLKLEEKYIDHLITNDILALDMECSAVFNAAKHTGKKAVALFYATDILKEKHVLRTFQTEEKRIIKQAINYGVSIILEFAQAS